MDRFKFNPDILTFQKVRPSRKQKTLRFLGFALFTLSMSLWVLHIRDMHLESPRVEQLLEQQEITHFQLELMNKEMAEQERILENVAHNDDQIYRVYFEQEPWPATQREVGVGGSRKYDDLRTFKYGELLARTGTNIDRLERKLVMQSTSFDQIIERARDKEEYMAARPAIQPVSMKDLTRFGSSFGIRYHPILKVVRPHEGIDLSAPRGTSIYATADGKVLQAGYRAGGFGKKILLDHGFGFRTLYGHCDEVLVKPGQEVKRGEIIGKVGSTGLSKAPHLHYEVHVNGRPVDPINYYANDLSASEYEQMIDLLASADPSFDIN